MDILSQLTTSRLSSVTIPDVGDGFTTDTGGASPTSSAGLGGLVPTSILGDLLPSHTSGASQRPQIPLKVAGVGTLVTVIITTLGFF